MKQSWMRRGKHSQAKSGEKRQAKSGAKRQTESGGKSQVGGDTRLNIITFNVDVKSRTFTSPLN